MKNQISMKNQNLKLIIFALLLLSNNVSICQNNYPAAPIATAADSITRTSFTANWTANCGDEFYLDVALDSNFINFVPGYNNLNVGNVTSYNVTGLKCNTTYYYRVRASHLCLSCPSSNSDTIAVTTAKFWCLAIGGSNDEWGSSIIQTSDGGYALTGKTSTFGAGSEDVYVIKLDSCGEFNWTRTIGGPYNDWGWSIIQNNNGEYVLAGKKTIDTLGNNNIDIYVIKLNNNGDTMWTRTIGGDSIDQAWSIIQTSDGGYALTGRTNSFGAGGYDVYVLKLNSNGDTVWTSTIGGSGYEAGRSIIQTSDGGYIIVGRTNFFGAGGYDLYLIKLDNSGNLIWTKTIGGINDDYGMSIIQTSDGGYAIAGYGNSFGFGSPSDTNVYVVKLNSIGDTLWTRSIGGAGGDRGYSIIQTSDGGYAIAGYTRSFGAGNEDVYVVKLNSTGGLSWTRTIGGAGNDEGWSIIQTSDESYAITGWTQSFGAGNYDVYVVKLDSNGNTCCSTGSGGTVYTIYPSENIGGALGTSSPTIGSGGTVGSGGTITIQCP